MATDAGIEGNEQLGFGVWFYGTGPTDTERESGEAVAARDQGPLKPGKAGHLVLRVYADGRKRTAYDASKAVSGDCHALRRESPRLLSRGYLMKDGTLPNLAPRGRPRVDAYRITVAGLSAFYDLEAAWQS